MIFNYAKIYKITNDSTDKVYIGSTNEKMLSTRFVKHNYKYRQYKVGKCRYVTSFDIIADPTAKITLIENYPCDDKNELLKRERHWIEKTENCVNKTIPTRTDAEYYLANKERVKARVKVYARNHKEQRKIYDQKRRLDPEVIARRKIKTKCDICDQEICKEAIKTHERTKKHQLNAQNKLTSHQLTLTE